MAEQFYATVVRSTGSWYEVLHEGERLQCRVRSDAVRMCGGLD